MEPDSLKSVNCCVTTCYPYMLPNQELACALVLDSLVVVQRVLMMGW